jgi:hypothetical protein
MTRLRGALLQVLSLSLIFTSGLSLGVDVHRCQIAHHGDATHDSSNCPICQQALSNPKLVLPNPCLQEVRRLPAWCLVPVPESRVVLVQQLKPTSPRGPPLPRFDLALI